MADVPLHHDEDPADGARVHTADAARDDDVDDDALRVDDAAIPAWYLYVLAAAALFALGYWFHHQVLKSAESRAQAYHREMRPFYAAEAARLRAAALVTPAALTALSRDDETVRQGRETFGQTCVVCHGPAGAGGIGPNLTDNAWIHGGAPDRIYRTVSEGVVARGMPAWGATLGAERIQAVTAYLLTIRNTNVAGGRAPQGRAEP